MLEHDLRLQPRDDGGRHSGYVSTDDIKPAPPADADSPRATSHTISQPLMFEQPTSASGSATFQPQSAAALRRQ